MKQKVYRFIYLHFPSLWFSWAYRVENRYQSYVYSRYDLSPFDETLKKFLALAPVFSQLVKDKTFLELGCDTGFFVLQAARMGASRSLGIDRNGEALARAERARQKLHLETASFRHDVIPNLKIEHRFDTVLFMSSIHYMFSNKQGNALLFGSMESLVGFLSQYVGSYLLVEFVEPEDPYAKSLVCDDLLTSGEYSEQSFLSALHNCFARVIDLGRTHRLTRRLFLACRSNLPALVPLDTPPPV